MSKRHSWRRDEHFPDDLDNNVMDYISLPDGGVNYFSLSDAAILFALDQWWGENGEGGDPYFWELLCDKKAKAESENDSKKFIKALTHAVDNKFLDAKVLSRNIDTLQIDPSRTYALLGDMEHALDVYGIGCGHMVDCAKALDNINAYDTSAKVARNRIALRMGLEPDGDDCTDEDDPNLEALNQKVVIYQLRASALEKQLQERSSDFAPINERSKASYLNIIGSLLAALKHKGISEAETKAFLDENRFTEFAGVSIRNLEKVFPEARKRVGES